jgi:ankyrin repeat protein
VSSSVESPSDRFIDLACLCYSHEDAVARREQAREIFDRDPTLAARDLHVAAAVGDLARARRLLDAAPSSANAAGGPRGWGPLLSLCYSRVAPAGPGFDALAVARLLLERGADPNGFVVLGSCRFSAITGAMGEGENGPIAQPPHPQSHALVTLLLDAGGNPNDSQGLYNTHFQPSTHWLELFLSRGLSAHDPVNWGTESKSDPARILDYLLGQAVVRGHIERVRLLLAHGADAKGQDSYEHRPHYENAVINGHPEIAALLVQQGATATVLGPADQLRGATLRGDEAEVRRLLVEHPEFATDAAPLLLAAGHGQLAVVRLLLDRGLPIDMRGTGGRTALHEAAGAGHLAVVRELVDRGAALDLRDHVYSGTPTGHATFLAERWPTPGRIAVRDFLVDREKNPAT